MDEIQTDAGAESSTAEVEQGTPSPGATDQVTPPTPTPEPPFHQHPRFRELTSQNREMRQQLAQMQEWARQQTLRQQQSQQGQPSQQEMEAIQVLKKLMKADPELAAALGVAQQFPQFQQRLQGYDQMQARAAQAHNNAARSAIKEMATAEGLDTSDASMKHIVRVVAGAAMDLENGNERYANGDLSVLQEAFDAVKKGWFAGLRKPAAEALTQTKNKLRQMPPPARGTTPGAPAPAKLEAGKERAFEADLHERAKKMLSNLSQG